MKVHSGRYKKKSYIDIVDECCCPISPWISNYFSIHLSGKATNSQRQYAKQLKSILQYFNDKNIDIVGRVASGDLFSRAELNAFISSRKFKDSSELSNIVNIIPSSDKSLENAIHASRITGAKVKARTTKGKVDRFIDYLSYLYNAIHFDNIVPANISNRYEATKDHLSTEKNKLKDFNTQCDGQGESALPTDKFLMLIDIIHPDSPDNPFTSSKLRNYVIVLLLIDTGIRRGAAAKLKIEDCKFWGSYDEISIVRRPDDVDDSRGDRPVQKTKAHKSFVSESLMIVIKQYIDDVRSRYSKSREHGMIFIAEKNSRGTAGQPLSLSSINKIFQKLSRIIQFHIHPHLLRRKFNEVLTEYGENQGMPHEEVEKIRKYIMGWTRDSKMADIYNEFMIYQKARSFQAERQNAMIDYK